MTTEQHETNNDSGTSQAKALRRPGDRRGQNPNLVRFDHADGRSYYPYRRDIAEWLQGKGRGSIREERPGHGR